MFVYSCILIILCNFCRIVLLIMVFFSATKVPETTERRPGPQPWRPGILRTSREAAMYNATAPNAPAAKRSPQVLGGNRSAAGVHHLGCELPTAADLHKRYREGFNQRVGEERRVFPQIQSFNSYLEPPSKLRDRLCGHRDSSGVQTGT